MLVLRIVIVVDVCGDYKTNDYKNHNKDFHQSLVQTGFSQARSVLPAVLNVLDKHNISINQTL